MNGNGDEYRRKEIEGGVCAPAGFFTSALSCGFFDREYALVDLGLVAMEKPGVAACIYTQNASIGAPLRWNRKTWKGDGAHAFVFNDGVANVFQVDGEETARAVQEEVAKELDTADSGILVGSTGQLRENVSARRMLCQIPSLVKGLEPVAYGARQGFCARNAVVEFAYAFDMGSYIGKIGALFVGRRKETGYASPLLGVLTTDVCIAEETLQRALTTVGTEWLQSLCIDGVSTPNDMLCLFSSARAENYPIERIDSEYKKFVAALRSVLKTAADRLAFDGRSSDRKLLCVVTGARSMRIARAIAREIVGNALIKRGVQEGAIHAQDLVFLLSKYAESTESADARIFLSSNGGKALLYEEGNVLRVNSKTVAAICSECEVTIEIVLRRGNYTASATGCDLR